jgi:hypothetical protein
MEIYEWDTQTILSTLASIDAGAVSDDFTDIQTPDYRLLRYPQRFLSPTMPEAQVVNSHTSRSLGTVFDEISTVVSQWGLNEFHWWVTNSTLPLETEEYLRARGGILNDCYQIMARVLDDNAIMSITSTEIHCELVKDERSLRDAIVVETAGWGRSFPNEQTISVRLDETLRNLETSSEFQFVAYVNGQPVSTGTCKIVGQMARLFGAVTLPAFRSLGCYRVILSSRLRQAREVGATIAVTRARPLTSGQILTKAGFTTHALENCYRFSTASRPQ